MVIVDTLVIDANRRTGLALLAGAVVLAAVTGVADAGGRLLAAPAALLALVLAVRELRGGALLRADREGVVVRQGWRTVSAGWDRVERLRVVKDRRAELLEIDVGATVLVLSRQRLGRYPADVLDDLQALRP